MTCGMAYVYFLTRGVTLGGNACHAIPRIDGGGGGEMRGGDRLTMRHDGPLRFASLRSWKGFDFVVCMYCMMRS